MRHHHATGLALAMLLAGSGAATPAGGQERIAPSLADAIELQRRPVCTRPFRHAGQVAFAPAYSGVAGHFDIPAAHALRIDRVTARLHQPGLRGAEIGGDTDGAFGWHVARLEGDLAVHLSSRDGAIYLDPGSLGKVVVYRWDTGTQGSGEFAVEGCLVERIPATLRMPDLRVPRLPPRVLLPGEDRMRPPAIPAVRDGGAGRP